MFLDTFIQKKILDDESSYGEGDAKHENRLDYKPVQLRPIQNQTFIQILTEC